MLTHLNISNYTIVSQLETELQAGMTVVTGETGAGKSIMLDALGLCLGDRADPKTVRHGESRAEITASFDISAIPAARAWLENRDLLTGDECILRRVITAEGRSRAYINGSSSTLQDCAELGQLLVDIHSQHEHQSLLRRAVQRQLLDGYAGHMELVRQVEACASDWLRASRELELLAGSQDEHTARAQLLTYQVEELDQLQPGQGEVSALEEEQKLLANAEEILSSAHRALDLCHEHESGLHQALRLLDAGNHPGKAADNARDLLDSAAIQLSEAKGEIQAHIDRVEVDPERLEQVRRRLDAIYDVARKHRCLPEEVATLHERLREELDSLAGSGERIDALRDNLLELESSYTGAAAKLSKQRRSGARKLERAVTAVLANLAMEHCRFTVAMSERDADKPHPHGREEVEFTVSTNPGGPTQPLRKIASGGELSRISLAIQVVTASTATVPSMIFDEVDVGIGGAVAEVVGRLLRELGAESQVLCVTHLPQVASQGHQHLLVEKSSSDHQVVARLHTLDEEHKTQEIARMLGGVKITEQSLAHAREMLAGVTG